MEEEFVNYEQALALQQLGFDWGTYEHYDSHTKEICDIMKHVRAPLKQQVFRWFREEYDISVYITRNIHFVDDNTKWKPVVGNIYYPHLTFDTYEKAENAAIDKLIELAKQL